ncbi:MAG: hypothetical protein IJ681_02390 [Bacteroidales bacterium]|nr:hypothetical protein [Bacteroidales bacterium]
MSERAEIIGIFVRNGVYDLDYMRDHYNNLDSETTSDDKPEYVNTYSNGGHLFGEGGDKGKTPQHNFTLRLATGFDSFGRPVQTEQDKQFEEAYRKAQEQVQKRNAQKLIEESKRLKAEETKKSKTITTHPDLIHQDFLQLQAERIKRQQDNIRNINSPKTIEDNAKEVLYNTSSSYRKSLEGNLYGKERELYQKEKKNADNFNKAVGRVLTSKGLLEVPGIKPMVKGLLNDPNGHYVGYWNSWGEGDPYLNGYGPDNLFFINVPHLEGWNLEGIHNLLPRYDSYLKSHYPNEKLVRTYSVNTIEDNENSKPPYYFEPDTNIKSYESFPPMNVKDSPIISSGNDYISYFMDNDGTVYKRVEDIYKYHPKDLMKTWGDDGKVSRGSEREHKAFKPLVGIAGAMIDENGHPMVYTTKWNPVDTFLLDDSLLNYLKKRRNERQIQVGFQKNY